jgi:CRISPR-associated exonuclease Cas4
MLESNGWSLWLLLLLLLAMLWLSLRSRRLCQRTGLPQGDVIYTDTGIWFANDQVLQAPGLQLVGRPDYLVDQGDGLLIPVELKSSRAPAAPREGHVLQLAAYCLLVQENYGVRPTYGILQYKDKAFAIDYTDDLEEDLMDLLAEIRQGMFQGELDRDHNDWARCAACGLRDSCFQRLA